MRKTNLKRTQLEASHIASLMFYVTTLRISFSKYCRLYDKLDTTLETCRMENYNQGYNDGYNDGYEQAYKDFERRCKQCRKQ